MKSSERQPEPARSSVARALLGQSLGLETKSDLNKKNSLANSLRDSVVQSVLSNAMNPFGGMF